jgi:hypothetical protein
MMNGRRFGGLIDGLPARFSRAASLPSRDVPQRHEDTKENVRYVPHQRIGVTVARAIVQAVSTFI